jgi:exopolyphosphatase/guanosine-5'-triphosphate,3'-diphosphate pyrophosphatase
MRYAAVDIGTNSCRLLIAEKAQPWQTLYRGLVTTRIGEGVDSQGKISPAAVERTIKGLQELQELITRFQVEKMRVVGTSALREAANREEFVKRVGRELNWQVDIISGEEEAQLSYLGVRSGLLLDKPPLVVDIGGGSTEFMIENSFPWYISLPLGAVRAAEADWSDAQILSLLAPLDQKSITPDFPLVVVGGTATTLAAMQLKLSVYDSRLIHGQSLTIDQIQYWRDHLAAMSLEERQKVIGLQPQRADIIVPGIRILTLIMAKLGYEEMLVSESDILDGVIAQLSG